jgi:DNA (cytosine-5)-methyltransferase 1
LAELVGADSPLSSGSVRWPCAGLVAGPKRKAAWRVLDAQHFGVPQRRRRIFVVASPVEGGGNRSRKGTF